MATVSSTISLVDNISEKLSKIQTSVNDVVDSMGKLGEGIKTNQESVNTFSWENFSSNAEKAGERLSKVGGKMTLAITTPLVLLGKKLYSASAEHESAVVGMTKTVEGTTKQYEHLYEVAQTISETTPMSFVDVMGTMQTGGNLGVKIDDMETFARSYSALVAATDQHISGESGAKDVADFLNIMDKGVQNIERFGSSIVYLGNNFNATEDGILAMANRMASAGHLAGFSTPEVLGMATAFSAVGINAEAGGSAASKLIKQMQLSAEVGAQAQNLLSEKYGDPIGFSYYISDKDNLLGVAQELGVTTDYVQSLADSWLSLEQFSEASGKTAEQFQQDWAKNPAQGMTDFFYGLSKLDSSGAESTLAMLDKMGITEIRESNLVAAMSSNPELFSSAIASAIKAYAENTAMWTEFETQIQTQESQNAMLGNKLENSMADFGDNLVATVQPALDAVNSLLDTFNSLGEADQQQIITTFGVFALAGPVCSVIGETEKAIGKVSGAVGKIISSRSTWEPKLVAMFGNPAFWGIMAGAGILLLLEHLDSIPTKVESIIERAGNIPLTFDQASVDQALDQIAQVQSGLDLLNGNQQTEEAQLTSQSVKMGFGTQNMYNTALAYESATANAEVEKIINDYSAKISEAEFEIARVTTDAERNAWLGTAQALKSDMDASVAGVRERYAVAISDLFNGMASQYPESASVLERAAKQYDLMSILHEALTFEEVNYDEAEQAAYNNLIKNMYAKAFELGYMDESGYNPDQFQMALDAGRITNHEAWVNKFYETVTGDLENAVQNISDNPVLATMIQTMMQSDSVVENLDFTSIQGALDGMVGALDFAQAAQKVEENGGSGLFGQYLIQGLANGVTDNASLIKPSFETVRDNALAGLQSAFDMHSPSVLMQGQGLFIPQGLALGVTAGGALVAMAMTAVSNMAIQIPSSIMTYAAGYTIGLQITSGMVAGIQSGLGLVAATARLVANAAVSAAKSALDIHSPSGVFFELGTMTGEGYVNALQTMAKPTQAAIGTLLSTGQQALDQGLWATIGTIADLENKKLRQGKDSKIKLSDSDVQRIRELAEREVINQFTTAELHIEFNANNKIDSALDLDGVVTYLEDKVSERLEMVAEGVYD